MATPRASERLLVAFTGALLFLDMVGYTAILPLLPELQPLLGISEAQVGILVAGVAYGTLAFGLPSAALAGRIGPRRVVLGGAALTAATFIFTWTLPAFGWMAVARVAHGVASSAMWVAAPAWVVAATEGANTGRVTTRITALGMLGTIIGPTFGGWLTAPGDLLRSLLVVGVALAALTAYGVAGTRVIGRVEITRPPRLRDLTVAWRSRLFLVGALVVFGTALAMSSESVVIVLGLGNRGVSERTIGVLFTIGGLGIAVAQSASYRVFPRRSARVRGSTTLLILGLTVVVALVMPTVAGLSTSLVLMPVLGGLAYGLSIAFLADGAEQAGSTVAVGVAYWSILWAVGASIGPTLAGAALGTIGETVTLAAVMGATILLAGVVRLVRRDPPRQ